MANKALLADLQSALSEYLETHRNLSIQSVSNKANVSYSTIRRILQNEANDVRDETILSLIQVIMSRPRRIAFLNKFYPALGSLIIDSRPDEPDFDQEKLRLYRYKDPHNYILKMALTNHGTCRATIQRILGDRGTAALDEMIEDHFLVEDSSGSVQHTASSSSLMNASDILHQIKKDSDYFDKSLVGTNLSRLAHLSASLNPEAYMRLIKLVNDFIKEADSLKEAPESTGQIPMYIDLMVSTYDRESLEGVI
ncbi:hypothetical protein [Pseudobacteriovorax antillogorgiicola]|uniref:Uncharacterized protein n=1 Tax=Pseudobacteriovorax antillogorgiicola TaxID=1513793 RepID=A0A1Y6BM94_9BACT|nr:hypothetical protein [Pseudobacteriovorax antillogorgiicola]TCS55569.1 hypothetical protein EDD56_105295 [Pseudobacteriovorax antillogorgiicola]SMF10811.1 hypothetical protein SAMN06296036_10529 [Pseudobacteriovorax antillogorgiicola]